MWVRCSRTSLTIVCLLPLVAGAQMSHVKAAEQFYDGFLSGQFNQYIDSMLELRSKRLRPVDDGTRKKLQIDFRRSIVSALVEKYSPEELARLTNSTVPENAVQSGFKEWIEKAMVNTLNQVFGKNLNQNNNEGGLQIRSKGDPEDAISF